MTLSKITSLAAENRNLAQASKTLGVPLKPPPRTPCATCPWRLKFSRGVPNPNFPDPGIIDEAWQGYPGNGGGAKHGLIPLCHRGADSAAVGDFNDWLRQVDEIRVCAGVVAIQQREAIRFHEGEPAAVDQDAAERVAARMKIPPAVYRSGVLTPADLLTRAHPAISDPLIGYKKCKPVKRGEFDSAAPTGPGEFDLDAGTVTVPSGIEMLAARVGSSPIRLGWRGCWTTNPGT